jgi:hypothetical protein
MKKRTAAWWFSAMVGLLPAAVARADDQAQENQMLDQSAGARSGADRLGGATMTSPPHAWTATGQNAQPLSSDDLKKEHPRNRSVVGPPVPKHAKEIPQPPPPPAPEPAPTE